MTSNNDQIMFMVFKKISYKDYEERKRFDLMTIQEKNEQIKRDKIKQREIREYEKKLSEKYLLKFPNPKGDV